MDIIKTYLENMFAGLPKTKEVLKMKDDLLANMQEKYLELKNNGKTENEAIGIVISEFGNIEELANELGINIQASDIKESPTISMEEAIDYMNCSKKMGRIIAFGVFLCIVSPILLILLNGGYEDLDLSSSANNFFGLLFLFIFVATAVGMFIYGGMKLDKYKYLKENINIPDNVKSYVKSQKDDFDGKFIVALIVGIILYILSPTAVIGIELLGENASDFTSMIGVSILLLLVAIATYIIVSFSIVKGSHNLLLRLEEYTYAGKESEKVINAIAGVYWPLLTAAYLFWSFTADSWAISWILFPIAGVIFGGITSLIRALKKDK